MSSPPLATHALVRAVASAKRASRVWPTSSASGREGVAPLPSAERSGWVDTFHTYTSRQSEWVATSSAGATPCTSLILFTSPGCRIVFPFRNAEAPGPAA